jgi:N-methylhydantoinase B
MNAADAVVSGYDDRHGGPFVNQLILSVNGGPASALADGWVPYGLPVCSGLMYRDSVEIDELKMPIELKTLRLIPGTAGAGRHRGVPSCEVAYGPREHPITVIYPCDGQFQPPKGVLGGQDGLPAGGWHVGSNGYETKLPNAVQTQIRKGELIRSRDCSSGGYGDPLQRDPRRVLHDVLERWETLERAREVYGVAFTGSVEAETLAVDIEETARLRAPTLG